MQSFPSCLYILICGPTSARLTLISGMETSPSDGSCKQRKLSIYGTRIITGLLKYLLEELFLSREYFKMRTCFFKDDGYLYQTYLQKRLEANYKK